MADLNIHILRNAIQDLPEYEPSPMVLANLMAALSDEGHNAPVKSVGLSGKKTWALVIVLLVASGCAYFFLRRTKSIVRTEEVVAESVAVFPTDTDLAKEQEAIQYIRQNAEVDGSTKANELNALQTSLDELEKARKTLTERLTPYSQDPVIVSQLAEIERKKSEIIAQMLKFV